MQTEGADAISTLSSLANLATFLTELGRHSEAEPLLRQALATRIKLLGPVSQSPSAVYEP